MKKLVALYTYDVHNNKRLIESVNRITEIASVQAIENKLSRMLPYFVSQGDGWERTLNEQAAAMAKKKNIPLHMIKNMHSRCLLNEEQQTAGKTMFLNQFLNAKQQLVNLIDQQKQLEQQIADRPAVDYFDPRLSHMDRQQHLKEAHLRFNEYKTLKENSYEWMMSKAMYFYHMAHARTGALIGPHGDDHIKYRNLIENRYGNIKSVGSGSMVLLNEHKIKIQNQQRTIDKFVRDAYMFGFEVDKQLNLIDKGTIGPKFGLTEVLH